MEIKKEGKVIFENGQIIEIRDFEVAYNNNYKDSTLEEYVKKHYIKV